MDRSPEAVVVVLESLKPRILNQFGPRIERLVGARSGAADLYQEVSLKTLRSLHKCRAQTVSELEGWIITIAQTTANRLLSANLRFASRAQKREAFRIDRTDWAAELQDEELTKVEVREEAAFVLERMAGIHSRYRQAVTMYYLHNMGYDEICERMQCGRDAARLLVSRGLKAIRKQIENEATRKAAG